MTTRKEKALSILHALTSEKREYHYLGKGATSVVFHDTEWVYKVFFTDELSLKTPKSYLLNFLMERQWFANSRFLYSFKDIKSIQNNQVLIYKYEPSEPCFHFEENEILDFLIECWQYKVIFKDVKPKNFIRVNGFLKFIDYDPDTYTDNLFLNMAARAFIYCKYRVVETEYLQKLARSAVNQFDLPELDGLQAFLNRLFAKIIFEESKVAFVAPENGITYKTIDSWPVWQSVENDSANLGFSIPYEETFNPEIAFFEALRKGYFLQRCTFGQVALNEQNYFAPDHINFGLTKLKRPRHDVSFIIKACVQDAGIIYEAVKHIVRQTASPDIFAERILALDIRKSDFLREYNKSGTWEELIAQAQRLVDDKVIDSFIFPAAEDIQAVNLKWFGLETGHAHSIKKVPVASQLFAFEKAKHDYILQVDCDAMIGRRDYQHSFLDDMMAEFEKSDKVVSVGFNIYKGDKAEFTPYFGFENGGFVPEVRFCLLHRKRIEKLLPLPNEVTPDGLKLTWYRSLEIGQKETGACSIRGGHSDSFFIHPQNFKKTNNDVWFTMLDRVEQLQIPEVQAGEFDLAGSYYDWTGPKRNEKLVVVSCFRNISLARFLRFWYSLFSQEFQEWGLVLIDDASENGTSYFIRELTKPFHHKVTFIRNSYPVGTAQNIYKVVHYFMQNQESAVAIVDTGDALVGKNALSLLSEKYKYWKGDMVAGKEFKTTALTTGQSKFNFVSPRTKYSEVWQNMFSFKKYLFDSLGYEDFKILNKNENWADGLLLSKRFTKRLVFTQITTKHSYAIPIAEMSTNPKFTDYINYYRDEDQKDNEALKKQEIDEILAKPQKDPNHAFKGRRTFLPNLQKIEIDITYECNLKCINCNRSSAQAPVKEGMSLEQIQAFVRESIELGKKWELINILGGEPTIHRDFLAIVGEILDNYIIPFSPDTILQVTSNGYGELVQERLRQLPQHPQLVIDYASFKDDKVVSYFSPFNDAPIDHPERNHDEYHKGCWVTSYCGIGLNQLGYYPCGVAGGIDRIFELNLGVKSLKDVDETIANLLNTFCRYCGNFTSYAESRGNFIPRNEKAALTKAVMSET